MWKRGRSWGIKTSLSQQFKHTAGRGEKKDIKRSKDHESLFVGEENYDTSS